MHSSKEILDSYCRFEVIHAGIPVKNNKLMKLLEDGNCQDSDSFLFLRDKTTTEMFVSRMHAAWHS